MADTINQDKSFRTILIVRNDGTTSWENSTYCLRRGELGLEYLTNGKVKIKAGAVDSNKTWKELPYVSDNDALFEPTEYQTDENGQIVKDENGVNVVLQAKGEITTWLPIATAERLGRVRSSNEQNKILVFEDGTMEVNSLSTDKLVQGTNTLVLDCGSATTPLN